MRILLDESVPVQVRNALSGHKVATAVEMGWRGISNGELLECAEADGFDLLVIADKNFQYQQNLEGRLIAVLELWTIIDPHSKITLNESAQRPDRLHVADLLP